MGYARPAVNLREGGRGHTTGGYASQFPTGMANPAVGGVNRPTGRVDDNSPPHQLGGPGSDYGLPTAISRGIPQRYVKPNLGGMSYTPTGGGPTHTSSGTGPLGSLNKHGTGHVWDKGGSVGFNEPGIPELRDLGDIERYTGEKWAPSEGYESSVVDTGGLVDATDALLKERMGGEMSEAARRFGQSGALMSGGGLGGSYAGTLGESERGYRRDYGEMAHRYRFQAEQADADRKRAAYDAAMGRELGAHEGYEGRRFADVSMANEYGLDRFDRETDHDWDKYGAELGAAERERQQAIAEMMEAYGG